MAKKVIRLTEGDLKNIISENISVVLNEIGYRGAALTHGANYNAKIDKKNSNNPNAIGKANASNKMKLPTLTQALHDNFPNIVLPFMEEGMNEFYGVVLDFQDVAYIDNNRLVLKGKLTVSGYKSQVGCIEYNFSTGLFYRVIVMANGAIRRTKEIEMDPDGKPMFDKLLTFISNYLYSCEDYENEVNSNGATQSKQH